MQVRRVVTGHTPEGKATVASNTLVDGLTLDDYPGPEYHKLWSSDEAPTFPDDGSESPGQMWFPPVGGFNFGMFVVAPQSTSLPKDFDRQKMLAAMEAKIPGMMSLGNHEPDHPGMHTTDTIDFEYVISGEVWLELDDGEEVHLRPGDTVVQNGTRHAWRNRGTEPCRMLVFLLGAHRAAE